MKIEIGHPISEDLSGFLKEFTSKYDRADIHIKTGVSASLLNDITYRSRNVTEDNKKGLISLMERASENAEKQMSRARKCKKNLREILDTI